MLLEADNEGRPADRLVDLPGDLPGLQSLHLDYLDVSITAVTNCTIGFFKHEDVLEICHKHPGVGGALWHETLVTASVFREWVTTIGQRDAAARIAHLFCELYTRFNVAGLADEQGCPMPLTQGHISEAAGLSTVHVNRSIQTLRAGGLIRWKGKRLDILDWKGLKATADFNPAYLQLASKRTSLPEFAA